MENDPANLEPEDAGGERDTDSQEILERLRIALAATIPGLTADAISGSTLAEVEASYASTRAAFIAGAAAVREEVASRIPAGSPARSGATSESSRDKIRRGLTTLERSG